MPDVTLASANIRSGHGPDDDLASPIDRQLVRATGSQVIAAGASVIALNEAVRSGVSNESVDVVGEFESVTGLRAIWCPTLRITQDRRHRRPVDDSPVEPGWFEYGNALLLPISAVTTNLKRVCLPALGEYEAELRPDLHEPRCLLLVSVEMTNGFTATLAVTHLSPRLTDEHAEVSVTENEMQLHAVLEAFRGFAKPWILFGDLNVGSDVVLESFDGTVVDMFRNAGFEWAVTGPTHRVHEDVTVDYQFHASDANGLVAVVRSNLLTKTPIGDHHVLAHDYRF